MEDKAAELGKNEPLHKVNEWINVFENYDEVQEKNFGPGE